MFFDASLVISLTQKNEMVCFRTSVEKQFRSCDQGQFCLNGISICTCLKNQWATCKQLNSNIDEGSTQFSFHTRASGGRHCGCER